MRLFKSRQCLRLLTTSTVDSLSYLSWSWHNYRNISSFCILRCHLESATTVGFSGIPREDTTLFRGNHLHHSKRHFTATIAPHSDHATDGKGVDVFTESLQRKIELELQQLPRFDKEQDQTDDDASLSQATVAADTSTNRNSEECDTSGDNSSSSKDIKREVGGPKGPEPTRYGDWERGGRCSDF